MYIVALFTVVKNCNTQISFNWRLNKHAVMYPYKGILFSNKKRTNIITQQ